MIQLNPSKSGRLWLGLVLTMAVVVGVLTSPARASLYSIQKNQQLYGNLNQNQIPQGGQFMCGPTAAANSFVYLERAYPAIYGRSLVPDTNPNGQYDLAELIAVAQSLAAPINMNTKANLAGGGAGTWDDMFIYGKMNYIEAQIANQTVYEAQLKSTWAWLGNPPRPIDEIPPIAKPLWVHDRTQPDGIFLFNELNDCEDVEILIVDGEWGHILTVTGLVWNDADNDQLIDAAENATLHYIDPATGLPGVSPIGGQIVAGDPIRVNYGTYPMAELFMTVSESPVPEPATFSLLILGGLSLVRRGRRRI